MKHVFQIKYLDIRASYFKGKVGFEEDEFTITIQDERRGKVLRLPFHLIHKRGFLLDVLVQVYLLRTLLNIEESQNGSKLILPQSHFT